MNLVSEFFYEGIRRIVPGLIYIALFWRQEAARLFAHHIGQKEYPFVFSACILVMSWLFGFATEQILNSACVLIGRTEVGKNLLSRIRIEEDSPPSKENKDHKIVLPPWWSRPDNPKDPDLPKEMRRLVHLITAEKIMSRSLSAIFFWAWISHFLCRETVKQPEDLLEIQFSSSEFFFGFILFFFCWLGGVMFFRHSPIDADPSYPTVTQENKG